MTNTAIQEVKEDLAQMGVKKGSRFLPILAFVVTVSALILFGNSFGSGTLDDFFLEACKNVTPGKSTSQSPTPLQSQFRENCQNLQSAPTSDYSEVQSLFQSKSFFERESILNSFETKNTAFQKLTLVGIVGLMFEFLREYVIGLANAITEIGRNWLKTALLITAGACIAGVFGMIYRRSFSSWFLAMAATLVALDWIVPFFPNESKPGGGLILIFLFVVLQIAILFAAFRLRHYARTTSTLPTIVTNTVLAVVLIILAVLIVLRVPSSLWNQIPFGIADWSKWWLFRLEGVIILFALYGLLRRSDVWQGAARKNIVVCLDGTTNTPDQMEFGRLAQTNVFKLFKMLKGNVPKIGQTEGGLNASITKRYGNKQIGLYYTGVGNRFDNDPIVQAIGGATGLGAADIVDKAYFDVLRLYRPGDRIFIFGFSRGAAIARLLARAIDQKGMPRSVWSLRMFGRDWTLWEPPRDKDSAVPIAVLGCWDTVAAFGLAKNLFGLNFQKIDLFKDFTVPDNVDQAIHAVALDERREEFQPTLMEPDPTRPEKILEVWFSGDHANIGGG